MQLNKVDASSDMFMVPKNRKVIEKLYIPERDAIEAPEIDQPNIAHDIRLIDAQRPQENIRIPELRNVKDLRLKKLRVRRPLERIEEYNAQKIYAPIRERVAPRVQERIKNIQGPNVRDIRVPEKVVWRPRERISEKDAQPIREEIVEVRPDRPLEVLAQDKVLNIRRKRLPEIVAPRMREVIRTVQSNLDAPMIDDIIIQRQKDRLAK